MKTRWWWMALGAVGMLAVQAWSRGPDRHWIERDGADWSGMGHEAQTAYAEGFLAGAALGQAAEQACIRQELRAQREGCEWAGDSAGLTRVIGERRQSGGFRFPYGANVYASRISDFYWWENHRSLPTWYAFWEVNATLTRPN